MACHNMRAMSQAEAHPDWNVELASFVPGRDADQVKMLMAVQRSQLDIPITAFISVPVTPRRIANWLLKLRC